ncbi:MAG: hypothetical protein NTW52_19000 [Planctomycetota bacterium]|nr:hypothetical protein [Planctomycetota bacterium]
MSFHVPAVAYVTALRPHAEDDFLGNERACITLIEKLPEDAFHGLEEFSQVEILLLVHIVEDTKIVT